MQSLLVSPDMDVDNEVVGNYWGNMFAGEGVV